MDVNRFSFGAKLPTLLTSISKAHFVAIDLELSGIHTKLVSLRPERADGGKQTLQDRYRECKEAAEKYQVLQVGITCVEEDKTTGEYVARPYNFNLSPLIEYKIDLDRDFTFQSGAISFLLDHGFKFDNSIAIGVPYLSRQEESDVRQRARDRSERSKNMSDLKIQEDDTESLEFVQRVREQIRAWTSKTPLQPDYLNIAPPNFEAQPQSTHGLNNFQKRLVHQLVRGEFPGLITLSKPTFIQILAYNEAQEASRRSSRQNTLNAQIAKQTGLRWLVEAMVGGDLSRINPMDCAQNVTGESVFVDKEAITNQLKGLRDVLNGRQAVLIGHNIFTDLINFYKTFIGDLPDKVEDFQKIIHQMFPMVIDTKYLATHEYGSKSLRSSLEDLEEDLRAQVLPIIKIHYDHSKYLSENNVFAHEAGYDSFITAKVLIKLAARLEAEGDHVKVEAYPSSNDSFMTATENGGDRLDFDLPVDSTHKDGTHLPSSAPLPGVLLPDRGGGDFLEATGSSTRSSKRKRRRVRRPSVQTESQFSHPTKFDLLEGLDDDGESREHKRGAKIEHDNPEPLPQEDMNTGAATPDEPEVTLMPQFDTDFWRVYGNKLRVFGTKEEVFNLTA